MLCVISRKECLSLATLHHILTIPGFPDMRISTWDLKNVSSIYLSQSLSDTKQMRDGEGEAS